MQEREKSSTDELPTRFAVEFFLSYKSLKSRKRRIFFQQATYKGTYIEAVESARAGLSQKKGGREKEKNKTKEGGLSPQEGDVRKKKRKDQGRREGGSAKERFRVPPTKNFSFGSRVFGFGSGPSRLKYRLLRDLVYEEAMCEGSSRNRLPYTARAVP
jgi:hypothetical protein